MNAAVRWTFRSRGTPLQDWGSLVTARTVFEHNTYFTKTWWNLGYRCSEENRLLVLWGGQVTGSVRRTGYRICEMNGSSVICARIWENRFVILSWQFFIFFFISFIIFDILHHGQEWSIDLEQESGSTDVEKIPQMWSLNLNYHLLCCLASECLREMVISRSCTWK